MTRADLVDWIKVHGCVIELLPEGRARAVKFYNPKNNSHAFLDTPVDDREEKDYTVCRICVLLGIPIPDCAQHMKKINDIIEEKHLGKNKK